MRYDANRICCRARRVGLVLLLLCFVAAMHGRSILTSKPTVFFPNNLTHHHDSLSFDGLSSVSIISMEDVDTPCYVLPTWIYDTVHCMSEAAAPVFPDTIICNDTIALQIENGSGQEGTNGCYRVYYYYDYVINGVLHTELRLCYQYDVLPEDFDIPLNDTIKVLCLDDVSAPTPPIVQNACQDGYVTPVGPSVDSIGLNGGVSQVVYSWNYTDCVGHNHIWSCVFEIQDTVAPTFTVPADVSICSNIDGTLDIDTTQTGSPTQLEDNCSSQLSVVYSDEMLNDTVFRTWTVIDRSNNITSATQKIIIWPSYEIFLSESICSDSLPWTWRDTIFEIGTESDDFVFHKSTVNGCDSVVILQLTVNPSYDLSEDIVICSADLPWTWRDTTFLEGTTTNDFVFHRSTVSGCDSVVTLHLTVNQTYQTIIDTALCFGDSLVFNGITFNTPGEHIDTAFLYTVDGCDSTFYLYLNIGNPPTITKLIEDNLFLGCNITTIEDYAPTVDDFVVEDDCDPEAQVTIGEQTTINVDGCHMKTMWEVTYSNSYGIEAEPDTVVYWWVADIFPPQFIPPENISLCRDTNNEFVADTSITGAPTHIVDNCSSDEFILVTYSDTCTSHVTQQDTIIRLWTISDQCQVTAHCIQYIYINPRVVVQIADSVCQGEAYSFGGETLTEPGFYHDTLQTVNGCDSIVTLHLVVYQPPALSVCADTTIVAGTPATLWAYGAGLYLWYPEESLSNPNAATTLAFPTQTTYYHVIGFLEPSEQANLVVNGDFESDTTGFMTNYNYVAVPTNNKLGAGNFTIQTDVFNVWSEGHLNGYPDGGPYMIVDGANTTETVWSQTVNVEPNTIYNFSAQVATLSALTKPVARLQFVVNDEQLGPIFDAPTTQYNWVKFHDFWFSGDNTTATIKILNQSIGQQGNDFGLDHIVFFPVEGCQSEDSVLVTVVYKETVDTTICANDNYEINGHFYDTTGTYIDTLTAVNGCDSIVTTNLTVAPTYQNTIDTSICYGYSYHFNNHTYYISGEYWDTMFLSTFEYGCDSVVMLHLVIDAEIRDTMYVDICQGDTFNFYGLTYTESGSYMNLVGYANSCPKSVVLLLTVHQPEVTYLPPLNLCIGDVYHGNGFDVFATHVTDTTYMLTDTTVFGCDSTVYLPVKVNPSLSFELFDTICHNESYDFNGTMLYEPGVYNDTLISSLGCDSVVTLHLTVNQPTIGDTSAVACESFTWHGITYVQSGDYTYYTTNAAGCDSIVTLHLTINQPTSGDTTAVACESFTWHGITYVQSGDCTYYTTNAAGCDSTVTLHLTINQPTAGDTSAVACENFTWHGITYVQSGDFTYYTTNAAGCDSIVTLHLTINQPTTGDTSAVACESFTWHGITYVQSGDFTYYTTNAAGCDSIVTLHLTINQPTTGDTTAVACESFTWHGITYVQSGDCTYYTTNAAGCDSMVTLHLTINQPTTGDTSAVACESFTWHGITYVQSGDYTYYTTNAAGCDSVVTLHLTFVDLSVAIVSHTLDFCDQGSALLEVETEMSNYVWSTGETSQYITVYGSGVYSVTATEGNCSETAQLTIEPCEESYNIGLPNAFTPDGDGVNDDFGLPEVIVDQLNDYLFQVYIYNRWGEVVFSSSDKHFRWNGEVDGRVLRDNIYNYVIDYRTKGGSPGRIRGSVITL